MTEVHDPAPAPVEPAMTAATPAAVTRRTAFAGLTPVQLLVAAVMIALLIWAIWVTQSLLRPREQHIVKADLSRIVGDYVQAQSRSAAPPERVRVEMQRFMASLDGELQRRGKAGQVVLVGEAVLSKNVTDITADVASAGYASGIARPKAASAAELKRLMQLEQGEAPQVADAGAVPAPVAGGMFGDGPVPSEPVSVPAPAEQPRLPGAAVATFGGGDGAGAQ